MRPCHKQRELLDIVESGGCMGGMIIVPRFSYARASLISVSILNKSSARLSKIGNKARQWSNMGLMKIFTRKSIVWVQGQDNGIVLLDKLNSKRPGKNAQLFLPQNGQHFILILNPMNGAELKCFAKEELFHWNLYSFGKVLKSSSPKGWEVADT